MTSRRRLLTTACFLVSIGGGLAACDSTTATADRTVTDEPSPDGTTATGMASNGMSTTVAGRMVYVDRTVDGHRYRVGLNLAWGGVMSELSVDGVNTVNADDAGREIQISMYEAGGGYDACAGCTGSWGWNPVQGGDRYVHGSPAELVSQQAGQVHVRVHPLEWFPNNKGGGPTRGVPSDVVLDLVVSSVLEHPAAFRVRYTITHTGTDRHGSTTQELPAVYPRLGFDRFTYYDGAAPWSGGSLTTLNPVRELGEPWVGRIHTEPWGAHVDAAGNGVTVYVPGAYGHGAGWKVDRSDAGQRLGTNYFFLTTAFGLEPGEVREGEYVVIAGNVAAARETIYALHASDTTGDRFSPIGGILSPAAGGHVGGTVEVRGYALDDTGVERVEVLLDGAVLGQARTGETAPELGLFWGTAGAGGGFSFAWDTAEAAVGPHRLGLRVADRSGHVAESAVAVVVDGSAARRAAPAVAPQWAPSHVR